MFVPRQQGSPPVFGLRPGEDAYPVVCSHNLFSLSGKKKEKKREAGGQVYLSKAAEKHDLLSSLVSVFQSVVHAEVRVLPVGLSGRASAPARPLSFPRSRHLLEPHQLKF